MRRLLSPSRLQAIQELESAQPARAALEALTMDAMRLLGTPRSQISIVTANQQYTLAVTGVDKDGRAYTSSLVDPVENSICSQVVESAEPLSIPDARDFPVVCDMSCVMTDGIRAYLGHPILSYCNEPLGAFCVIDYEPRSWDAKDKLILASLANSANGILLQALMGMIEL